MGANSSLLWKFMITKEMNGMNADLFLGADQGMPQPLHSTPASFTQTPDNTGPAVTQERPHYCNQGEVGTHD